MKTEICSCQGLDAACKKCFGSGFASVNDDHKAAPKNTATKKEKKKQKFESIVPNNLSELSKSEVDALAIKLITSLDFKSKKQTQLLNAIPFNTTTFRRDFGDKFALLDALETEKQFLRSELLLIDQEIQQKKYNSKFRFKHYFSDKDLDVTSNRQLKTLLRAYKKLKNN
ncbi:hypothetical protein K5I29_02875 [Flavobacterium agricola]|uniref:Uncharacterized protein n=1 Tax=Flavobacterium agricola TaxID=2870839 RepID=A0ABY6LZZ7_9FLAO|nr:hypothetical protein [Flavobacterium agricola]UYW01878.1 hypothetical protein K5I29_02875 [Flavobacterium agricola]